MKVPLKEIANIRTGHLFRSRIKYNNEGDKLVIRPVDMDNDTGEIDYINLKRISDDVSKDTILCENDIIIKAKGYNNVASRIKFSGISPSGPRFREHCQAANLDMLSNFAPLTTSNQLPMVPSNHYIIIKVNQKKINPSFLAWFLNQETAQMYFKMTVGGTSIPNLKIKSLGELEIPIPTIEIQDKIVEVSELLEREKHLMRDIISKRKRMVESVLLKTTTDENREG